MNDAASALLSVKGLRHQFSDGFQLAVDHWQVEPGQHRMITGDNGSGKSTLLAVLAGAVHPQQGQLVFSGQVLDRQLMRGVQQKELAYVTQTPSWVEYMTMAENCYVSARLAGCLEDARRRMPGLAERLGVAALLSRYPRGLSGGEQQRLALLQAILKQPRLILADEPTAHIDARSIPSVLDVFFNETSATLVVVSHCSQLLARCADQQQMVAGRLC